MTRGLSFHVLVSMSGFDFPHAPCDLTDHLCQLGDGSCVLRNRFCIGSDLFVGFLLLGR